jgi:hypothetical protein
MTYLLIEPHQQGQGTCESARLFGSTRKKWSCYDFAQEFAIILRTLDHHFKNNANDGAYYEMHGGTFDVRDVKEEGEGVRRWWCRNDVVSKHNG